MMAASWLLKRIWILLLMTVMAVNSQLDTCGEGRCQNGGQCVDTQNGPVCDCQNGFTGASCETNVDDCSFPAQHECQNNAVCVDGVGNYTCACLSGWEGTYCEQEKDECMSQPCKNNGNCTDEFDGFRCDCPGSFTGPTCTQDIDECLNTSLCRNGATCQNEIGSFSCLCVPGYTGRLCDKEINECESSPCYFGGSCIDLINNFRCECLDGFLGPRCQGVVRQCQLNSPCGQNGICVEKPQGGYQCFCKPGYYGSHCEFEANLCASSPCKNGGSCTNFGVNYTCSCKAGFRGKNCETDIQECTSAPCQNNGTCSEPVPNGFVCQCQPGYTGNICQTEINECNSNPCQGRQACVDLINAYRCECPLGTTGALCETDIFDCRLKQCLNGGTCTQESDAHICLCPSPFTDQTCSTSMDPCVPSPCLYSGTCFRNGTGFGCVCADGYIGHRCEADVYDCLSNPCLNGGTCEEVLSNGDIQNNRVKFVCRCQAGFTGVLCEMEFVACMSNPCRHGATCISMGVEDYSCECTSGWRGDQCDRDINECLQTPPICLNGGQCINLTPGFKCVCPQQWTGPKCEVDIAGCAILTCLNGGTCVEGLGAPSRCQCSVGFTGSNCSVRLSSCEPNPCHNNATCNDVTNVGAGLNFTCQCLPGYTGPLCEGNIDECTVLKPCLNNATCLDEINGFTCDCIAGWTGATCDEDIDECVSIPCMSGGTCTDLPGGFHCECPLGFSGSTCSQEQSDCVYEPCRNNATCVDLLHGFKCECPPGFTGLACSIDIDECASSPCANRSTCVDGTNNFTCVCPPGFQGEFCEEDIQECSSDPCKNGGTCSEPVPGTYSCLCQPGVEGDNCDLISTATFGAGKSLTFPQLAGLYVGETSRRKRQAVETVPSDGMSFQLQFTFTTSVLDGILLVATGVSSTGQPQHIAIELQDSALRLSANNGIQRLEETIDLKIQGSEIHSHVVALTFSGINVDLQLDPNTCNSSVDNSTCSTRLLFADETAWNLNGPVHFGGVKDFTPYVRHIVQDVDSFTGCLGNLMVNGQAVNLAQATEFSSMDNSSKVSAPSYGCPTHTPCQQDTCSDGGVCRDMWTHLTCDCLPGFTDARCSRQYMAHFEEDSMLHFEGNYRISDISFTFSSANASGLFFYTVTADALCISLDSGQIRMQLIPVSGARDISSRVGSDLQLEDWVKVSLRFSGNQYTLEVSSNRSGSLGSVMGTAGAYILVTGPLFVGALHDHSAMDKWRGRDPPLPTDRSIQGCIRDVMVNNTDLDLATSVPTSLGNDPPMARPGCGKEEACLDNPCANQGECLPKWEGPVCQCGEGYTGDDCSQVSSATFDGNVSHSSIQLDRALEPFGESGKIEFRTRQRTSTVMLLQFLTLDGSFGSFIEFRVYTGRLQVYSGFSKDTAESVSEVSDGQWHTLTWVRDRDYFDLLLDGAALYLQAGFDPFDASLSNMVDIYIGARPFFPGNSSAMVGYFRGCMRDISFNDVTVQYASAESSHPGLTVDPVFLLEGCEGDRMCYLNPCPPNSYCVEDWDSYTCPCLDGWEGPACADSIDDCGNHSCKNAGVCVDGHLSYTCDCGESFTGQYCETFVRACGDNNNPCHPNNTNFCLAVNGTEYLCTCLPGYTGQLCDVLIDSCDSTPCLNGATCIDGDSNFVCICPQGFSGDLCEVRDFCFSQPCYNGGTCVISNSNAEENFSTNSPSSNGSEATVSLPYTCECVRPYIGSQCQTFDYCDGHLCQNNATCVLNVTKYTCKCDQDHYGTYCEYVDYCAAKPCLNGGDCRNNGDTYTCLCSFYYTGRNCETPVNQCKYDVCFNGATCVFNESAMVTSTSSSSVSSSSTTAASLSPPSSSSSSNTTEDFTYCICVEGYTGENCETDINECDSSPCLNNGTCEDSTTINPPEEFFSGFRCICAPGFYGITCEEEVNECNSTLCHNEGECIDLVNGYTCNCSSGFTGQNCEVDMRGCASSPCLNEAECEGYGDNFTCVCRPGFTGYLCEENVDDCEGMRCINGGTCQDGENSYTCDCLPGYSGQFCEDIIDSCYSQPCFNAGVCSYTGVCSCADVVMACGWSDETCQRQRCADRQDCNILSSSYICNCTGTGYKKPQCAQDLNECDLPNNPCQHNGVCVNTVGSYTCNCRGTGFHGDSCEIDDDECQGQNPCYNGGTCINTAGSYECQCLPEWSGERCGENRNDCNPNPCLNQGSCEDRLGGYVCNCDGTGFEGTNCTDNVDDCANHRCVHGAQCVDGTRQYTCVCDGTGYTGQFCETELGNCVPNPCQHNGTCSEVKSAIMCDCSGTGYHGNLCEFDVDECMEGGNKCQEEGTCVNVAGAYRCECGDTRTGEFCESALVQEQAEESELSEGAVAALIVLAFAILIVIALVVIWQVQRRRKTHGVYKPAEMEGRLRNGDIPMDRMSERVI